MTPFTTSKGEFIAVTVPEGSYGFSLEHFSKYTQLDYSIDLETTEDSAHVSKYLPISLYEIIGLSSDILKDEELAKKVVSVSDPEVYCDTCRIIFDKYNITGNQLIIKKK